MILHHGPAIYKVLSTHTPLNAEQLAQMLGLEAVEVCASLHRMRVEGEVVREVSDFNRYTYRLPRRVVVKAPALAVKIAKSEVADAAEIAAVEVQAEAKAPRYFAHSGPKPRAEKPVKKPGRTAVFDTPRLVEPEAPAPKPAPINATSIATSIDLIQKVLERYGPKRSRDIAALTGISVSNVYSRVNYLVERKQLVIVGNTKPFVYGLPLHGATDQIAMPFQQSIAKADIEADTPIPVTRPKPPFERASHTFAAALNVPESVMQCTYIAAQIDSVISKLDRPANAVLLDLISASQNLRNASAALANDRTPTYQQTGASP